IYQWNFRRLKFICNYSVEGGRQPFAERLRRLVCCCVVCCWLLLSSRPQGQVGEYADAMFRRNIAYLPRRNS
ncbi:MAG: hypothetical protein LBG58_12660, partial [Planctomycetaceae bacterium]|nr:hypothetical protein [Planctomycetaceae bacterium]